MHLEGSTVTFDPFGVPIVEPIRWQDLGDGRFRRLDPPVSIRCASWSLLPPDRSPTSNSKAETGTGSKSRAKPDQGRGVLR